MAENRRYPVLNGWKGIFAFFILMLHFEAVFIGEQKFFETGFLAVEGFFIISGFLLGGTLFTANQRSDGGRDPFGLVWHRMKKVYPAYLYALIFLLGMYFLLPSMKNIIAIDPASLLGELMMMQMTGIFPLVTVNPICWYISVLMIATFLIAGLVSLCRDYYYKLLAPVAIVLCYSFLINKFGTLDIYAQRCGLLWGGLIRGFAAMNIGMVLFFLKDRLVSKDAGAGKAKIWLSIRWNILEWGSALWILWAMFQKKHSPEDFLILIPMVCMVLCAVKEAGFLSVLLKSKPFQMLGELSFILYITQLIPMYAMKLFLPQLAEKRVWATLLYLGVQLVFALASQVFLDILIKSMGKVRGVKNEIR